MAPAAGTVVAYWADDGVAFGVVAGEEKQRVLVVTVEGREERLPPSRLAASLESGPPPARTPEGRHAAAARAQAAQAAVARDAAAVDVATLWELVADRDEAIPEAALAELALGRVGEAARLATALALRDDGVRFLRKTSGWQPREAVAVREILAGRERAAQRAIEKEQALGALRRAWSDGAFATAGSESEKRFLAALEVVAVHDLDATDKDRALAAEAIEAAGIKADRPSEAAFRLLRRTGRFASDDENLPIVRFGLRTSFSEGALSAAAGAAARGFARAGRRDLTAQLAITIDDAATREVDDALTLSGEDDGAFEIGVHIADPCAFVEADDPVDLEARARGTTYYFPERKLLMVPSSVSEEAASLVEGAERPALSFLVRVGATGRVERADATRSVIRVASRLDYDEADEILRSAAGRHADLLKRLAKFSDLRESARRATGAIALRAPETEIRVAADGTLTLTRRDPDAPSQRIVSEAMILAGEVAASWFEARRVPAIFRRQAPPEGRLPDHDPALPDAVHIRKMRKMMKRAEASLHPAPHHGLGLPAYAQVTSPLRRYQDLALHRQIVAVLEGRPAPYAAPAMQAILAATERAENEGRRAERAMSRYWMLRWLERARGGTVTGVVVDVVPRPVVVLDETLFEEAVPSLVGSSLGDRVRLKIERVNPRADVLVLRPA